MTVTDKPKLGTKTDDGKWQFELPKSLDMQATEDYSEALDHLRDTAVILDASKVEFVGALFAQLLVAVQAQWRKDGIEFSVVNPSEKFNDGLILLGLPEKLFSEEIEAV